MNARGKPAGQQPVIDGWLLSRDIPDAFAAGDLNGAALMIGATADDVRALIPQTTPEALATRIKGRYGANGGALAALYFGDTQEAATAAQDRIGSDFWYAVARAFAGAAVRSGRPAFVYGFNRAAPGSDAITTGAFHCAELVYVFGTQNVIDRPWEVFDRELSDQMSSYWVRFAETGDPNGPGLPPWPAFDPAWPKIKEFGTHPDPALLARSAPLFDAYLATRLLTPPKEK
jgi:para-nitrobenzyl esterase